MMRLIEHLKTLGMSNKTARSALLTGKVWIGGIPTSDAGREVEVSEVEYRAQAPRMVVGRDVVILWRDEHLAVVWKPPQMLSVPAKKRKETNVMAEVGRILGTVHTVHRLDEGTSGLMMVARTAACQLKIKDLLEKHDVERRYLAIVRGRLTVPELTVCSNLVRDRGDGKRGTGTGEGREAITKLRSIRRIGGCSLIEATLETGRTHQVRIHLNEKGCPILGDRLYAKPHIAALSSRLALHASVLGFVHPITKETLRFEAPLADDLVQLCRDLENERPPPRRKRNKKKRSK